MAYEAGKKRAVPQGGGVTKDVPRNGPAGATGGQSRPQCICAGEYRSEGANFLGDPSFKEREKLRGKMGIDFNVSFGMAAQLAKQQDSTCR